MLTPASLAEVRSLCALVARRRNVGYDFGAFKDGLGLLGPLEGFDELLLANDSVYGPFHGLSAILRQTDAGRAAVWGITDSWEFGYHLQSYFLLFKRPALLSPAFAQFWRRVRYVQSKTWVVLRYEVGLSRALIKSGLRCAALYPYRQAASGLSEAVRVHGVLDSRTLGQRHHAYLTMLSGAVERGKHLGSAEGRAGDADAALACLDHSLRLAPDLGPAHHKRGLILSRLRRWDEGVAALRRAAGVSPDDRHILCDLAVALQNSGAAGPAEALYRRSWQLESAGGRPLHLLSGLLIRDGRADEAAPLVDRLMRVGEPIRRDRLVCNPGGVSPRRLPGDPDRP